MPSSYTPNYNLNQWARTDQVLMADFNADNAKIDGAIRAVDAKAGSKADASALEAEIAARTAADETLSATLSSHAASITKLGNCQIYSVTYAGDGSSSRSFTFPHRPLMVFAYGEAYTFSAMFGITTGHCKTGGEGTTALVSWGGTSIRWEGGKDAAYFCNASGKSYRLVALLDMEN